MAYKNKADELASRRAYRAKNPEKIREWKRSWTKRNPAAVAAHRIKRLDKSKGESARLRERYPELYRRQLDQQKERHRQEREARIGRPKPDVCDACGGSDGGIVYDHCHIRGHPRGWLCDHCNVALGLLKDDADRLLKLIAYLKRTKVNLAPQLVLPGV